MISSNKDILQDFYKQFNSRLTSLDFVLKFNDLRSGYNPRQMVSLLLPTNNKTFEYLASNNYSELIQGILQNIHVENSCRDVFISEMNNDTLSLFEEFIKDSISNCNVIIHDQRILINTYDMFADLIWAPISQFHSEVTGSIEYFDKYIEAFGGNKDCLFLNANSSTAFSYFIQIWVCEIMGIPLNPNYNNILVV